MTWRTRTNCVVGECKRYPCDVCGYHYDFQLDRRQAFVNWFRFGGNLGYHLLFVLSVLFAISVSMALTFAWLEAARRMENVSLLLTVPLGIAFAVHSCMWASLALYSLWQYPKAFWRWKNQTLPLVARQLLSMTTTTDPEAGPSTTRLNAATEHSGHGIRIENRVSHRWSL